VRGVGWRAAPFRVPSITSAFALRARITRASCRQLRSRNQRRGGCSSRRLVADWTRRAGRGTVSGSSSILLPHDRANPSSIGVVTDWFARPVLHVSNVEASLRFYVDRVGFTIAWQFEGVAQVDRDGAPSSSPNIGPRRWARVSCSFRFTSSRRRRRPVSRRSTRCARFSGWCCRRRVLLVPQGFHGIHP
jgi:hypothetical protein